MTITPTGRPAWEHANSHDTYGGHTDKANYQSLDVVNARTDVSAQEFVRIAADLAALQRTASFTTLVYRCRDTVPDNPLVLSYLAMGGNAPTGLRVSDGRVTWTWDASYPDPYSVDGLIHIVGCTISVAGNGARASGHETSSPDLDVNHERVEVLAFDNDGLPVVDAIVTLTVHTGQPG